MASRPLLRLPSPKLILPQSPPGGGASKPPIPITQQRPRIPAQFQELQRALNQRRLDLGDSADGLEAGKVLVLETNCAIEDFQNALKRIPGLEWLGEELADDHEDEEDEYPTQLGLFKPRDDSSEAQPESIGHFYLAFTNQSALQELERLWKGYDADQEVKFSRGLSPFREVFQHLNDIRPWGVEDRLRESGLLKDWTDRLHLGEQTVPAEIELWFRTDAMERRRRSKALQELVLNEGGSIVTEREIEEIRYHALLVRLPSGSARRIVARDYTKLVQSEEIMFVRAMGQIVAPMPSVDDTADLPPAPAAETPSSLGKARVALLDGLPLANHRLLAGRLEVDDPDDWSSFYQSNQQKHGTAMASLILHGNSPLASPLSCRLYVRPILRPNPKHMDHEERCPEDGLIVDLIYRALRRIFEGEGEGATKQAAVAPEVVVVNLSVGDPARPFLGRMLSPWARLLDWASWKYKILFCVSAGNHPKAIEIKLDARLFRELPAEDREQLLLKRLSDEQRHRRILSPGEAINVLTVGGAHSDASERRPNDRRLDLMCRAASVSPISAQGPGFRHSVKPELLFPGGRVLFNESRLVGETTQLHISEHAGPPGHSVAVPSLHAAELERRAYMRGTSCAAAFASRTATQCLSLLDEFASLGNQQGHDELKRDYQPALLKTMLVHGAAWDERCHEAVKRIYQDGQGKKAGETMTSFYGYGIANPERAEACTGSRATMLGWGAFEYSPRRTRAPKNHRIHEYQIPIPSCLNGKRLKRKLVITLGWLSPIHAGHRRYRQAKLWFEMPKEEGLNGRELQGMRANVDRHAVRRGTVQHEVFMGEQALTFAEGESLVIRVHGTEDAEGFVGTVPYGLCVSLEVDESAGLPIYEEIRARIGVAVRVPVR